MFLKTSLLLDLVRQKQLCSHQSLKFQWLFKDKYMG